MRIVNFTLSTYHHALLTGKQPAAGATTEARRATETTPSTSPIGEQSYEPTDAGHLASEPFQGIRTSKTKVGKSLAGKHTLSTIVAKAISTTTLSATDLAARGETKNTSVNLPESAVSRIEQLAAEAGLAKGTVMRLLLEDYIANKTQPAHTTEI